MLPLHHYFVAIIPPSDIVDRLSALQHRYNLPPWEPSVKLHITLVPPLTTHQPADGLIARLAPLIINRQPFEIELDGLGRFDNEQSVIFTIVKPNSPLTTLADNARKVLQNLHQPYARPFNPHLTLANQAPQQVIDEYFQRLAGIAPRERFWCDRFMLLLLDEELRRWNIIREFIFTPYATKRVGTL